MLPLSEKIYLLAIHPKKGGIISAAYTSLDYVILGSLFLELYLNENIVFENKRIIIRSRKTTNPIHEILLEKMSKSGKQLKVSRWISKFHFSAKRIRRLLQKSLSDKRLIRMEEKRFLFFRWKRPVVTDKQKVFHLLSEIENCILKESADKHQILLLSMLKPAGLMKRIFREKDKRKKASRKLKKMMVENQVSVAVADAIAAAQSVAASVAATSAATTAASS